MHNPSLLIPLPPHFSFGECLWFLDRDFDECLHRVGIGAVTKAIIINGEPLLIRVASTDIAVEVTILQGKNDEETRHALRDYVADWLDMDRDLEPFYPKLLNHAKLAYMPDAFAGLRLIGIPDLFEALCWSIIGQQINLTFAYRLKRRLVEKYGTHLENNGVTYPIFPTPEALALATPDDLRVMQFSAQKAQYLIGTARAFLAGEISKTYLLDLPDFAARQKALLQLKGIGIWSANYALMKSLREPACIPYGDAGLLNALIAHDIIHDKKDAESIDILFKDFAGWESYLVFYLWRSLAPKK